MRVFLDPGHGGNDPGAVANGMRESDIVLDIGLRLAALLERAGIATLMSRAMDYRPVNRAKMANDWGADLCVSLHVNAGGGTGVETIIPTASPGNPARDLVANRRLAEYISKALGAAFGLRVRRAAGVMLETETRHDFVGVLRNTRMISVLPEIAFIDAPGGSPDLNVLRNRRQEVANTLYAVICTWVTDKEDSLIRYQTIEEINKNASWAADTVKILISNGIIRGNEECLNLSEDLLRMLVWNHRAGLYDHIPGAAA